MKCKLAVAALVLLSLCVPAAAVEDPSCRNVRFADVGWSDIAATTGLASAVLEGLGYKPGVTFASVPVALTGLKNRQIDVFLGYWDPVMTPLVEPFVKAGHIQVLAQPNLVGARHSLAVPQYLYDRGLKDFSDISRFQKELQGKIFGIESGSDGNTQIQAMIRENRFGLQNFQLVASSEAGMLAEVQQAVSARKAIVFLGWEPHPMNNRVKLRYLTGGDDVFGANLGAASVYTAVPSAFEARCPNVAAFLNQLQFTTDIESQVMGLIQDEAKPTVAARNFLRKNPALLERWLRGVTTFDGRDGLAAVTAFIKRPG